jgi:signal peptidase II
MPDWMPFFGGQYYAFWPIFNVADATIFCSVATLLIFNHKWTLPESQPSDNAEAINAESTDS